MTLRLIATGGTFDKLYDPIAGRLDFGPRTCLHDMLPILRLHEPVRIDQAMLIDSLDMTAEHREQILGLCRAASEPRIVIIHGTDTMSATARVLGDAMEAGGLAGKTIVLTGAMVPWRVADSDAMFNLGHAIACARLLASGVHIAMNGRAIDGRRALKDRAAGRFVEQSLDAGKDRTDQ